MSQNEKINTQCKNPLCLKGDNERYDLIRRDGKRNLYMEKYFQADEFQCPQCHSVYYKCNKCDLSGGNSSLLYRSCLYRHHSKHHNIEVTKNERQAKKSKVSDKIVIAEQPTYEPKNEGFRRTDTKSKEIVLLQEGKDLMIQDVYDRKETKRCLI